MDKIKELTDFYMWMQENGYDHNIRGRVERKAEMYLSGVNVGKKLPIHNVIGSVFSIHDLKCGNLLNYDTAEGEILPTVIDWQDLKWLAEDPKGFNLVHSGIKLTKEILLSFGFKDEGTHLQLKLRNNWAYEWFDNSLGFSLCKGNKGVCLGNIQYVHELQNLYYCFTGVMLSLN